MNVCKGALTLRLPDGILSLTNPSGHSALKSLAYRQPNAMPDPNPNVHEAITNGDVPDIHSKILASEFILLSTSKAGENEEENVGALTAELDDVEVLIAFTSEEKAKSFVDEMEEELFSEDESVDGILVDGAAMLEYMPDGYGLLLDPELEPCSLMKPDVTASVLALQP